MFIWETVVLVGAQRLLFCVSAMVGLALVGCGEDDPPEAAGQVTRIVSLAPNLTEILFELGLGDRVVAVTQNSNWPAEAASRPKAGTFWQPNIEAIVAARQRIVDGAVGMVEMALDKLEEHKTIDLDEERKAAM